MSLVSGLPAPCDDDVLTRRALAHARAGTTDMADRELRVPLHYYRDPKITDVEESQILRRVPLAIAPSAQLPQPNDFLVRSVLGTSLLVTRDRTGASRVLLNYCRHRGAMPACGAGNASRFVCPYHAWTYRNTGELFMVPGRAGFDSMNQKDYGLVELPSQEKYGFIWAVLTADGTIHGWSLWAANSSGTRSSDMPMRSVGPLGAPLAIGARSRSLASAARRSAYPFCGGL